MELITALIVGTMGLGIMLMGLNNKQAQFVRILKKNLPQHKDKR